MEKSKIENNFNISGQNELILRVVDNANELQVKPPIAIDLAGDINSVYHFLIKRVNEINQLRCHIIFSLADKFILLVINEDDPYEKGKVTGVIMENPNIAKFGINSDKKWTPAELGQFCKMNRHLFNDLSENMKLVSDLRNFSAKVNIAMDKQKEQNGSFADNYSGVVTSNLPEVFHLKFTPILGTAEAIFEVEIYPQINGREVTLQLFSPALNSYIESLIKAVIGEQLIQIMEIAPNIVIIER